MAGPTSVDRSLCCDAWCHVSCLDRRHLGATRTVMALPCFEELTTVIVVPVFGTLTLYQPGW